MFIQSLLDPLLLAIVNTLDTLHHGWSIQGIGRNLPRRKLDHLSPRQHAGAKQFPYCSHTHAEPLGSLFGGECALRLLVAWVVGRQVELATQGLHQVFLPGIAIAC